MFLMSSMLQIWMKLMVLMRLVMSNLTIMTMMMILMMIRPGEGGTFCWLASQPASRLAGRTLHTLRTFRKEQNSSEKVWPPPLPPIFYLGLGPMAGQPAEGPAFSRPYHHQYHHHSHDCQITHHQQHKYHKLHPYLQHEWHQQQHRTDLS